MRRAWVWMAVVGLACSGGDGGDATGDDDDGAGVPTCEALCEQIETACGADDFCVEECTKDADNAASCDQEAEWEAMLDCCDGADFAPYCPEEDGFDPCQSGACGDLRPSGAASGC